MIGLLQAIMKNQEELGEAFAGKKHQAKIICIKDGEIDHKKLNALKNDRK